MNIFSNIEDKYVVRNLYLQFVRGAIRLIGFILADARFFKFTWSEAAERLFVCHYTVDLLNVQFSVTKIFKKVYYFSCLTVDEFIFQPC